MNILIAQNEVRNVAERWREQYGPGWGNLRNGDSKAIYEGLKNLPPDATPADVAAVIGNCSWLEWQCVECRENVDAAVDLGGDDEGCFICFRCLEAAWKLIQAKQMEKV